MSKLFKIGGKTIGHNYPTLIIAEIGQNHNGSLIKAKKLIKLAKKKGADAVKFQTHFASEESTLDEPFRVSFTKKYKNRYSYWKAMEFTQTQWNKISNFCKKNKITFLSSPFSLSITEKSNLQIF